MRSTSSRLRSYTIHSYLRPDVRDPKRGARGSNFDRGVGGGGGDGNEPREGEHVLEGFLVWSNTSSTPAFARGLGMERTRRCSTKLNRLRATRHPVSALRKEAAGPLSRDPEGRPHDLAPCTLEPWAELQRGRDGALAGRPPGPGAAPHAARHILVFSGLDRPVILERRLVSRQNVSQSHRFLGP